ncbi:hypothetical protein S7711_04448 [Stachybotrys chartarum IBT 7711]|uniref:Uncharacterized protein n=1 Tax=Stachybotrys chartarum (strain CBS 109288 / IBT 7711) TaxID=1280523 RepID=A0A084B5P3_STACB|nr:hypothetical protein S7711_04448 [Stachybotrys chartarum IBT 7711]KFA53323.1 hypothetical protein S40293_06683 [Stachybotrys chartarum IBT 40293]
MTMATHLLQTTHDAPLVVAFPSAAKLLSFFGYWAGSILLSFVIAAMIPFTTAAPQALINRLHQMTLGDQPAPAQEKGEQGPFKPSPVDIVVTRFMLARKFKLPPDVVDMIFDHAEYWAHSSNEIDYLVEQQAPLCVSGTAPTKNRFLIRSFPIGLVGIDDQNDLAEQLAYDTNEAKPLALSQEREPNFFAKLVDYPTPLLKQPVRKVVFTIKSKDQGWGGQREHRGTYDGSWTWFEAGLERFDAAQTCDKQCTYDVRYKSAHSEPPKLPVCSLRPLKPAIESDSLARRYVHPLDGEQDVVIQRNKTARKEMMEHVITWSHLDDIDPKSEAAEDLVKDGRGRATGNGEFVRNLKLGDVITVWAKARFPGWANHIERVKVEVYWAV